MAECKGRRDWVFGEREEGDWKAAMYTDEISDGEGERARTGSCV